MLKKNKILFLHGSNDMYGASKVLIQVINLLFKKGYEIHLILPFKGPLDDILCNKTTLHYKNMGVFRKKYFNLLGILNRFYKIISSIFFINNIIRDNNIDIVYTNTSVIIAGGISAKINSIDSFFHIHEIPTNKFYLSIIKRIIEFFSNKVILVSDAVKNHWNFNKRHDTHVIYNGFDFKVDIKANINLKNGIILTSIGRLIPYKGHLYLLKILKKLKETNDNFILYIIGDTFPGYENYESKLKYYVINNELKKNVIFTGFKPNVNTYLYNSDFFIHTAIEPDPLPTVILEAINLKIPIIATKIGGAIEILDNGNCGLLIPENNVDQSAKMILENIYKKEQNLNNTENAKKRLKKYFSKEKFIHNILSLFE